MDDNHRLNSKIEKLEKLVVTLIQENKKQQIINKRLSHKIEALSNKIPQK